MAYTLPVLPLSAARISATGIQEFVGIPLIPCQECIQVLVVPPLVENPRLDGGFIQSIIFVLYPQHREDSLQRSSA